MGYKIFLETHLIASQRLGLSFPAVYVSVSRNNSSRRGFEKKRRSVLPLRVELRIATLLV